MIHQQQPKIKDLTGISKSYQWLLVIQLVLACIQIGLTFTRYSSEAKYLSFILLPIVGITASSSFRTIYELRILRKFSNRRGCLLDVGFPLESMTGILYSKGIIKQNQHLFVPNFFYYCFDKIGEKIEFEKYCQDTYSRLNEWGISGYELYSVWDNYLIIRFNDQAMLNYFRLAYPNLGEISNPGKATDKYEGYFIHYDNNEILKIIKEKVL